MNRSSSAMPAAPSADASTWGMAHRLRRLPAIVLLALLCGQLCAAPAWPQMPDNRGVWLDPEDPVSPAYRETLDQRDGQRMEHATESGESFISTFQGTGRAPDEDLPGVSPSDDERADSAVREREPPTQAARPASVYESVDRFEMHGQDTGEGLAAMVGVLLESWTRPPEIARLRYAPADEAAVRTGPAPGPGREGPAAEEERLPPVAAGAGFYARTLYAVNSDYPGPVVLELLQPPLAGAVAHGGFERVGQRLVLRLTSLTWRGRTYPVDAWGVDPGCACYGIEGEVDRHFLARVLLPAAARFAEGFLTAVAMPARTLTMQDGAVLHERAEVGSEEALYAGLGAATRTLGDILMADAPKETTVRIPRDTPLVVMFATTAGRGDAGPPPAGKRR